VFYSCASAPPPAPDPIPVPVKVIPDFVLEARKGTEDLRNKALSVKANVAARTSFDQGETGYTAGKEFQEKEEWDSSVANYTGSQALYKAAYEEAVVKRDAARASLNKAGEERGVSEKILADAEAERLEAEKADSDAAGDQNTPDTTAVPEAAVADEGDNL